MNNSSDFSLDLLGNMLLEEKYKHLRENILRELRSRTKKIEVAKAILELEMKDFLKHPEPIHFYKLYAMMEVYKDWQNRNICEILNLPMDVDA